MMLHFGQPAKLKTKKTVCNREILPEVLASVSTVMSLICLAEAQAVTTRKAEENGNSSSLLAKLHHGVTQFLEEESRALETSVRGGEDIAPNLMEFMHCCKSLHALRGQRYHAETLKASGQIGAAIGVLQSELSKVKKKLCGEAKWKSVFEKEILDASEMLQNLYARTILSGSRRSLQEMSYHCLNVIKLSISYLIIPEDGRDTFPLR